MSLKPCPVKACSVFTSYGNVLITEPDENPMACCSGDEISRVNGVFVEAGTRCSICGEIIEPYPDDAARKDGAA